MTSSVVGEVPTGQPHTEELEEAPRKTKKSRRFQMELPPKSVERLERLKEEMEAPSYAEVMKDAIRLLEYFHEVDEEGAGVYIKDKDGNWKQVEIFM